MSGERNLNEQQLIATSLHGRNKPPLVGFSMWSSKVKINFYRAGDTRASVDFSPDLARLLGFEPYVRGSDGKTHAESYAKHPVRVRILRLRRAWNITCKLDRISSADDSERRFAYLIRRKRQRGRLHRFCEHHAVRQSQNNAELRHESACKTMQSAVSRV